MSELVKFLKDVSENRSSLLQAQNGETCEQLFRGKLKTYFVDMSASDDENILNFKKSIKNKILNKNGPSVIENTLYKNTQNGMYKDFFIAQPYGTQNYPDFLIFTIFRVFSIEIKYSTKKSVRPMWNSNLPKMDGIYFFGCYRLKQLTFFRGEDMLPFKERETLLNIWDMLEKKKKDWDKTFKRGIKTKEFENEYGFGPYIRKAYSQSKEFNKHATINLFDNPKKSQLENKVIEFVEEKDK